MLDIASTGPGHAPTPTHRAEAPRGDYEIVRAALAHITERFQDQPSVPEIASAVGVTPVQLTRVFDRWAGLTPKQFLQAVTLDHTQKLLRERASVLDATYDAGLSGPARLHDLFVTHVAMPPGAYRDRGAGIEIRWGWHACPFGRALVMVTDYGLAGLAFADPGEEEAVFADMAGRWPNADYREDPDATAPHARRIFDPSAWSKEQPVRVVLIGTDFEVKVWETLLNIRPGQASTYSDVASHIGKPKAARAVGAAVGRNPISFVVPCHRVLGRSGGLCGYHWGLTRKRAILGWEAGQFG
ncbi:bifunctional helix-turn-helix domain-containing protein/methylated-DNA--[protein]-cysteine S-methyltransferase [Amorphus orientalis]|uniref:methylated-DNA--[protein]-cysteine S-methyltransferase n=1 Tax=Amorphus orientalis TaxID=649198 RepID=A0AAE3VRF1_9HYPH|nr:bifunctional helix-turn-helix domain-containing protein/methylated-DNA--[protein]-cysteine S-methyltransferase [Amorphus orientalis]MDQ0316792.1 AraC family transcriptional regulator of adaptative response/methylated-DNA-[protein]-cysteine methyltransferase [Amorphus orientalis]